MTEPAAPAPAPATDPAGTEPHGSTEPPKQDPKPTETVEFWKQKAREQESRAKSNAEAAKKLADIEEAQKTETQRLTDRAEKAEFRAEEAEQKLLRLEVGIEKGLSPVQAKRLVGRTREELEADADELLATFKPAEPNQEPKPRRPVEQLRPGAAPAASVPTDASPHQRLSLGLAEHMQ